MLSCRSFYIAYCSLLSALCLFEYC
uniref:Uncharacterized protein n=2 Tax=Anguilla anguilla TaxID=7936 RepID=A0A0E9VSM6_ANGAN